MGIQFLFIRYWNNLKRTFLRGISFENIKYTVNWPKILQLPIDPSDEETLKSWANTTKIVKLRKFFVNYDFVENKKSTPELSKSASESGWFCWGYWLLLG